MDNKGNCITGAILWGTGILLLLAAAFDILPVADNMIMFLAVACFVVAAVIKKISKGSCCK